MKFSYRGYDLQGKSVAGVTEANSPSEATDALRKQGVFTTSVTGQGEGATASSSVATPAGERPMGGTRRLSEVAQLCRQLSILVATKTPLVQAIGAIERQTPPGAWRNTLENVRTRVEEGETLSDAMNAHKNWFDPVSRAMIAAGEAGASLEGMLKNLADLLRQQVTVRKSITGAMVYPVVLVGVSVLVLFGMILFVLPRFKELFKTLGATIPPTTQMLMDLSDLLRSQWWILPTAVCALAGGVYWAMHSYALRAKIENVLLSVPRLGPIISAFCTARLVRVLGVLLEAKVPMLDALKLARQATGHSAYAALMQRAEDAVTRGESLSSVMNDPRLISPSVTEAIASGERAGQIGSVMVQVAQNMDEDNGVLIKSLTSLIEPLILTVLGVVIGLVAIAMFMPLFDLTAGASGG